LAMERKRLRLEKQKYAQRRWEVQTPSGQREASGQREVPTPSEVPPVPVAEGDQPINPSDCADAPKDFAESEHDQAKEATTVEGLPRSRARTPSPSASRYPDKKVKVPRSAASSKLEEEERKLRERMLKKKDVKHTMPGLSRAVEVASKPPKPPVVAPKAAEEDAEGALVGTVQPDATGVMGGQTAPLDDSKDTIECPQGRPASP